MNTPPSVPHSHTDTPDVKKDDSSPSFLPGIKSFHIDRSKYMSFGHLMAPIRDDVKKGDDKELASSLVLSSPLNPVASPLDSFSTEKRGRISTEEDGQEGKRLDDTTGRPGGRDPGEEQQSHHHSEDNREHERHQNREHERQRNLDNQRHLDQHQDHYLRADGDHHLLHNLDVSLDKSYSEDTMREMIRLRIEQERTKQTQYKCKLGQVVLQLLKDAETHGFGGDLIQKLFLAESTADYRTYMQWLSNLSGEELKRRINDLNGPMEHHDGDSHNAHDSYKHPSRAVQTPSPKNLTIVDIMAIQNAHSLVSLNGSQSHGGNLHSLARTRVNSVLESTGTMTGPSRLPNLPVYPLHVYPINHAPFPEQRQQMVLQLGQIAQSNPSGQAGQAGHQQSGQSGPSSQSQSGQSGQNSQNQKDEPEWLRLPNQKYSSGVYHTLPIQFHNPILSQPMAQMGPQMQGGGPYYYVKSLPPGVGPMTSQYFVPPPLPSGMMPWSSSASSSEKNHDEEHHHKRQKGTKNSINFMITTPKNPPAKKYNKL